MYSAKLDTRKALIKEGNSLITYVLGNKPGTGPVKRYVRAVEKRYRGKPLKLPVLVLKFPGLWKLFEPMGQPDSVSACERLETTIRNMGFGHSANDMANNMAKIRNTYIKLPTNQRDSMPALLQYELDIGMHQNHKIKEVSAANGFLWLGRSVSTNLEYREDIESIPSIINQQAHITFLLLLTTIL